MEKNANQTKTNAYLSSSNSNYQVASTYSIPAILLSRSFTITKPVAIHRPVQVVLPTQTTTSAKPNVQPPRDRETLKSCAQRHNSTYSLYSSYQKPGTPLSNALKTGGDIRLPLVLPIMNGDFSNQGNNLTMHTSVVLVIDENLRTQERHFIIVDTGLSNLKQSVIGGLLTYGVDPSMIDTIIITHPDIDTMGNLNLFPCAQVFSVNRISKENLFVDQNPPTFDSKQSDLPFHKLFDNTKLYLTPGFGFQDQSLVVHNVENHGTVAVVGKLVLNKSDLTNSNAAIREFASEDIDHRKLWQATRREIVCLADFIIPGNGAPFKVNNMLKEMAECSRKE